MIIRYTFFYTGLVLGLSKLTIVVLSFLDLESNSGLSMAMAIVSAMLIGQLFGIEQKRTFTKRERHLLAAACTLAGTVASIVLVVFAWMYFEGVSALGDIADAVAGMAGLMAAVTLVVLLIVYGVTWLGLGLGANIALKQQAAKSAKE